MRNTCYHIKLNEFQTPGTNIFNSRPYGMAIRYACKIDALEQQFEEIVIHVPKDTIQINTAFLEELLENVVIKLGEENFNNRFRFENPGEFQIASYIHEAIEKILRKEIVYV